MISIFKKFFDFSGKQKKNFYISLIYAFFLSVFEALKIPAIAIVFRAIVDNNMTGMTALYSFLIMLVSVVGGSIMRNRAAMRQTIGGYSVGADKRIEISERLKFMPMGYFTDNNLGHITSVTTNTTENLQDIATRVIQMYLQGVITTTVIILALFIFDWRIGLIALIGVAVFALLNMWMQHVSAKISPRKAETDENIVDAVLEYVQGISVVKSYNLDKQANQKVGQAIDDCNEACFNMEKKFVPIQGLQILALKLTGVAIILGSIIFFLAGTMPLFSCLTMIVCSFIVFAQLESAGTYSALLRSVDISVDKIQALFNTPVMPDNGTEKSPNDFSITANHLDFSYDQRKILDDINFSIPENTLTAIVGPSGGGKTTLCNLIARFWDPDKGEICIGGKDIRSYSLEILLGNISMVFQNVYLFHDTIANNIKFGEPNASQAEIENAAKLACCHEFIMALPDGYDTMIGEGGATLSGGEKQRISIARAMLKDASIVILDEATASVDPENEKQLQQAIEALTKDKTIIMIAHRLKTVRNADQILVVDHGRIIQNGTHDELITQSGLYADFVKAREQASGWKIETTQ